MNYPPEDNDHPQFAPPPPNTYYPPQQPDTPYPPYQPGPYPYQPSQAPIPPPLPPKKKAYGCPIAIVVVVILAMIGSVISVHSNPPASSPDATAQTQSIPDQVTQALSSWLSNGRILFQSASLLGSLYRCSLP